MCQQDQLNNFASKSLHAAQEQDLLGWQLMVKGIILNKWQEEQEQY